MMTEKIFVNYLWVLLFICAGCSNVNNSSENTNNKAAPAQFKRPYGINAPWNIPVKNIPRHPDSDLFAGRLWDEGCNTPGNFNLTFDEYTYPVYYTSNASGIYPVITKWDTNISGTEIPWNPDWQPASGTDAQIILLDSLKGYEWNLWQVTFEDDTVHATNGNLVQKGELPGDGSQPANYWSKESGFIPSRGVGIQYLAMLVRPEEIEQGIIRHALSMPIINTDGEFFVAPATKLEHPDHPSGGIPEGMRYAIDVTDTEINKWIGKLPDGLPEKARKAAKTIAIALRDYGWFITDSSGAAHLQFEDRATAGKKWDQLGLYRIEIDGKEYPRDLLDGLITKDKIYVLIPSDQYP